MDQPRKRKKSEIYVPVRLAPSVPILFIPNLILRLMMKTIGIRGKKNL